METQLLPTHTPLPAVDAAYDPTLLTEDTDEYCWTPLQLASRGGDLQTVREILEANPLAANEPARGYYGQTALQAACIHGHEDIVRLLVEAGADIHFSGGNNMQRNALQFACGQGNERVVEFLLSHGAEVNTLRDSRQGRVASSSTDRHRSINAAEASSSSLSSASPKTAVTRYNGRTALQAASERGHAHLVGRLLNLGADVNAPPSSTAGLTALQGACVNGFAGIVSILLEHGADVNGAAAKYKGKTALQAACLKGHAGIVDMLLDAGADVHALGGNNGDATALHAAAEAGNAAIVTRLVEAGANVNDGGGRGQSPVQSAARNGREDVVQLLRGLGAVGRSGGGKLCFS
ncbi:hypothetical protein QQS21_009551 [Conoideocrella luteorostrata]|uniref:Ankyrin repeat-containing domain protein n=1 Tax=Conoideocrella luteorostrata TaxID=1105319 RepID=A0AAJ0CJE3_9HYPO|nr:hypothetical protein QQS21_009551 [Conoideocrella luteorostrata]